MSVSGELSDDGEVSLSTSESSLTTSSTPTPDWGGGRPPAAAVPAAYFNLNDDPDVRRFDEARRQKSNGTSRRNAPAVGTPTRDAAARGARGARGRPADLRLLLNQRRGCSSKASLERDEEDGAGVQVETYDNREVVLCEDRADFQVLVHRQRESPRDQRHARHHQRHEQHWGRRQPHGRPAVHLAEECTCDGQRSDGGNQRQVCHVSSSAPPERRGSASSDSSVEVLDYVKPAPEVVDLSSDSEGPSAGDRAKSHDGADDSETEFEDGEYQSDAGTVDLEDMSTPTSTASRSARQDDAAEEASLVVSLVGSGSSSKTSAEDATVTAAWCPGSSASGAGASKEEVSVTELALSSPASSPPAPNLTSVMEAASAGSSAGPGGSEEETSVAERTSTPKATELDSSLVEAASSATVAATGASEEEVSLEETTAAPVPPKLDSVVEAASPGSPATVAGGLEQASAAERAPSPVAPKLDTMVDGVSSPGTPQMASTPSSASIASFWRPWGAPSPLSREDPLNVEELSTIEAPTVEDDERQTPIAGPPTAEKKVAKTLTPPPPGTKRKVRSKKLKKLVKKIGKKRIVKKEKLKQEPNSPQPSRSGRMSAPVLQLKRERLLLEEQEVKQEAQQPAAHAKAMPASKKRALAGRGAADPSSRADEPPASPPGSPPAPKKCRPGPGDAPSAGPSTARTLAAAARPALLRTPPPVGPSFSRTSMTSTLPEPRPAARPFLLATPSTTPCPSAPRPALLRTPSPRQRNACSMDADSPSPGSWSPRRRRQRGTPPFAARVHGRANRDGRGGEVRPYIHPWAPAPTPNFLLPNPLGSLLTWGAGAAPPRPAHPAAGPAGPAGPAAPPVRFINPFWKRF